MTIYNIIYEQRTRQSYSSTKKRDGCKDEIYLNNNSYLFFKKDGSLKKSTSDLYYAIDKRINSLFTSFEKRLKEINSNNENWEISQQDER